MERVLEVAIIALGILVLEAMAFAFDRGKKAYDASTPPVGKKEILNATYYIVKVLILLVLTTILACIWYYEYR